MNFTLQLEHLTSHQVDVRLRQAFYVVGGCLLMAMFMQVVGDTWTVLGAIGSILAGVAAVLVALFAGVQWIMQRYTAAAMMAERFDAFVDRLDALERRTADEHRATAEQLQAVKTQLSGIDVHSRGLASAVRDLKDEVRELRKRD